MDSSPYPSPKLFTRDLAAFTDVELDQYIEANGGIVDVEDYENLMKDEVLVQRLRIRARERSKAQPPPIDLDDLTTRLQHVSADRQARPRDKQCEAWHTVIDENENKDPDYAWSRETTEPLDEEKEYCRGLVEETEHYHTLVNEGGRPSHPLSLLGRDILENPGEYREILSYWRGLPIQQDLSSSNPWDWKVFWSQLCDWREFRRYQRSHREEGRFLKYTDTVKRSLARHEFTQPFELDEDPERQDKLTTWIEYLDYEHWFYDTDMKLVKRHQPEYDAAWNQLVDSKVLRPFETEEFICNIKSAFYHASERERAEKAVESAKSTLMSAQNAIPDPRRSNLSEKTIQQRLVVAQSKLDAAVKSLDSIKRRNDLVYEFYKKTQLSQITNDGKHKQSYQNAKDSAERRNILLRWILQQIPLIELELNQARMAENDLSKEHGRKRRKCNPADDLSPERVLKRRRGDSGGWATKRRRYSGQTSNAAEPISIGEPFPIQLDKSKPEDGAAEVPNPRKRQTNVYQKERESRRISHLP